MAAVLEQDVVVIGVMKLLSFTVTISTLTWCMATVLEQDVIGVLE
jgi:hypothetical protein